MKNQHGQGACWMSLRRKERLHDKNTQIPYVCTPSILYYATFSYFFAPLRTRTVPPTSQDGAPCRERPPRRSRRGMGAIRAVTRVACARTFFSAGVDIRRFSQVFSVRHFCFVSLSVLPNVAYTREYIGISLKTAGLAITLGSLSLLGTISSNFLGALRAVCRVSGVIAPCVSHM